MNHNMLDIVSDTTVLACYCWFDVHFSNLSCVRLLYHICISVPVSCPCFPAYICWFKWFNLKPLVPIFQLD